MKSIKKNLVYNTVYQIMMIAIPLLTRPYISRVLGAEGIGIYAYANSIAYYFVMFAHLGLNNYGNRSIARSRDNKDKLSNTFWSIYFLQVITSCISCIVYIFYIIFISDNKVVSLIMLVYVVSAGIDINWFFFGLEEFQMTAIRSVIVKLISVASIFLFVHKKEDVIIYCLIYVIGMILSQLILWTQVPSHVKFAKPSYSDIVKHIKPNIILFIPIIAVSLYKIMDKIMLGYIVDKTEVGYYESSEGVIQIPIAIVNSLGAVMLPRISNLVANKDIKTTTVYIEKSLNIVLFLASSMCFGIMGVSREFVPLFYGQGFDMCIQLFRILLPSCVFLAFANVISTQYLIPHQKDKEYIISVFVGAIVNLSINLLLIPKYGSKGAAIGTFIAELSVCVVQCLSVRKNIDLKKYILQNLPFVLSGIIMYEVLYNLFRLNFSSFINLTIKVICGIVLYFIILSFIELLFKLFLNRYYCNILSYLKNFTVKNLRMKERTDKQV
ncbi:MAG: flippase [Clostridia bacterium]|nr:flippase [Clostridia bacterium]